MNVSITLEIPPSVYRLAQKTAKINSRPVEQVLVDVLSAASPVSDDLPPETQAELDDLADLSDAELWKIARNTFPTSKLHEYDRLLEKNSAGTLSPKESEHLKELRQESDRLTLQKAHAYALLKWRGETLPSLSEIPRPQ